ncbi:MULTISPECIES: YncE family protein [Hymenobacter]|uniref:40-residue YVTN family beta-propeller repeat-containing protein n=1 Tax=Hymenobacter mucosus TaxID=1411120 RepID=A0A238WHG2_9BACT|nr:MULTISPECIES: YncE family protein [Hymenobacter]SNR45773.1 40-residue YVTN family beta-propeller repeat-containing protein [Hymenobacter mucosus]
MLHAYRAFPRLTTLLVASFGALAFASCDSNDNESSPKYNLNKDGSNVFVLNEGQYGTPNGEVSLFSKSSRTLLDNSTFHTVNQRDLGDVVQSMLVVGEQGYIVLNNSKKVEVVNLKTFASVATVNGLEQPRYAVAAATNKVYISEWVSLGGAGRVSVLDTRTNIITKTIAVGRQPEQLLLAGGKVYVANSDENTVSVINPSTDAVEATITVQDGPSSLVQDQAGTIWVLCGGITRYGNTPPYPVLSSTPANLIKLNTTTPAASVVLPFARGGASNLRLNGAKTKLYYRYAGAVYEMNTTATTLPATPLIRRSFYGFDVDPADNTIYGSVAPFTTTGKFIRYQATGAAIDSFNVGLLPNGFVFY